MAGSLAGWAERQCPYHRIVVCSSDKGCSDQAVFAVADSSATSGGDTPAAAFRRLLMSCVTTIDR